MKNILKKATISTKIIIKHSALTSTLPWNTTLLNVPVNLHFI